MSNQELETTLAELVAAERLLSARRRRLHARIAVFPDVTGELARRERELSTQRRKLHHRIDALRALRSARRFEHAA